MDTTFTFNIKAVSDMKDVVSNIENIQGALNKLKLPDNMKASFDKTFKSLLREVENYQAILNKPTKTKGDVTGLEKSGAKIITLYDQIAQKIKSIDDSTLKKAFKDLGAEEVKSLKQEISSLQTDLANLTKSSDFAKGLKSSFEDLKSKIKSADSDVSKLVNKLGSSTFGKTFLNNIDTGRLDLAAKNIEKIKSEIEKLKGVEGYDALKQWITDLENGFNELSKNDFIQNLTEKLKTLKTNLSGSEAKIIDALIKGFRDGTIAVDEFGRAIVRQNDNIKKLTGAQAEYNREVDTLKSRIQYFFGLNNAINLIKRTMRSAIQTIKDLDKAMTETAVVTDFTVSDMWAQLPEYTKRANELGVSTQAAYEAATLYYQQGLKTNQVVALSNETLKMARIAGLDAADATDRMTNALRGFNMELNETNAERVNDVYSKLAAISASNVDEISTAMTKVASLAHNAGMEFETTAAFLAQIIETTRESAETAGTALKTVVARFSEVKKLVSKDQLKGQDEEGQIIDVNKVSAALRTAGIDLNKYFSGEVGLDDIFMELASKWNSLTTLQQRYIATQAAGSRQQSRFIALMSDYARTQELVGEAYNANGAAAKQFAKTQDSLESKLARLKNAWNEFAMGILNSDVLKIGVDLLTNLLNVVNGLTTGFGLLSGKAGGFISSIAKIAVLLGGLKLGKGLLAGSSASVLKFISGGEKGAAFGTAFKQSMASGGLLGGTVKGIGSGIKGLGGGLTGLFTGKGFSAGAAAAKAATGAASLGSLGAGLAAIAVVVALAFAAYKLWEKFSPAGKVKRAQKALEKQKKELEEAENERDKLKNVKETYQEKTDQVNNATTIQDRQKAIEERNEMILKALEEDPTLAQYVITERIDDQLVLTIDEDSLAKAVEAAERVAQQERYDTAAAELNVTRAQLDQARSTSGSIISQSNYAATHFNWEDTTFWEGAKRVYGYVANPFSGNLYKDLFTMYARNNPTAAANFDIFGWHGEATTDEVKAYLEANKNTLTEAQQRALWSYINIQEKYLKLMDDQAQNLFYQRYAAEDITSQEAYDLIPLLAKFYKESGDNGYEWIASTESILKAVSDDQFASIIDAVSGKGVILDQPLLNFVIDEGNDNDLLNLLGINETTLERWNKFWGNDLTKGFIRNLAKQQQAIQIQNAKNLGKNLGRMDADLPRGTDFSKKTPKEIQDLLDLTNAAIEKLSPDQYGDFANFWFNNPDTIEEALKLFDSINLDNPIAAYSRLIKIQEKGTETEQELAAAILASHKELFSSSGLVKAFISSSSYEDLSDSLSDFIKENGEITADNIIELAKSNEDLNALLRTNIVSAEELARIFTLYEKGTLGFNAITDALIEAAGAGDTFYNTLDRIDKWIKDFNDGITSSTKGIEHITEVLENLAEHAEIGDITNTEFVKGFYHLFGEDAYNEIYDSTLDPQKRVQLFQQYISSAQGYFEDYGLDLYRAIWEKGELRGFTSSDNGGNNFGWDLSSYKNQDEVVDAFIEAAQKSTGITLDREAARATVIGFSSFAGIQDEWDKLGYQGALQTFATEIAGQEAVTQQTLEALGSQYGKTAEEIYADLLSYGRSEGIEIPIQVNWLNDDGTELTDSNLVTAFQQQGISLEGYKVTLSTGETRIDIDAASEGLKKYGLSQAQIDTILNKSGMLLAKQIFAPSLFGIEGGYTGYGLGSNVEEATEDANRRLAFVEDWYENAPIEDFINLFNGSLTPIMNWQKDAYDLVDSARFTADMDTAVTEARAAAGEAEEAATRANAAAIAAEQMYFNMGSSQNGTWVAGLQTYAYGAKAHAMKVVEDEGRTFYQRAIESLDTIPDLLKSGDTVQVEQVLDEVEKALGLLKEFAEQYPDNEILDNWIDSLESSYENAIVESSGVEGYVTLAYRAMEQGNGIAASQFGAQAIKGIDSLHDLEMVAELYGSYAEIATRMQESGVDYIWQAQAWRRASTQTEDGQEKEIYASHADRAASMAFDNIFTEALKVLYEDIDDEMAHNLVQALSSDDKRKIIDSAYQRDSSELEGTYLGKNRFSTFALDWFQEASERQYTPSTQEIEVDVDEEGMQDQVQTALDQGYTLNITSLEITLPDRSILTPKTASGATGGIVGSYAGGRHRKLKPGMALTGEEAPEIVWNKDKGYAYITGAHGPQFQNLKPGDQVFNGKDTKKILGNSETKTLFGSYWPGTVNSFGELFKTTKETADEVLEGYFPEGNKKTGGGGSGGSSKSSDEWKNELDWLYDLMEDIAEEEHKQTLIQAEYELAEKDLSKTGRDLYDLTKAELDTLQTQLSAQQFAFEKRLQQMNELQQKVNAEGFQDYLQWNSEDNTLEIDWDKINEITDKDTYDKLSELVSDMEKVQDQMDKAQEATLDIKKQIQELQTRYLQAYLDFQDKVMEAVVAQYQQNIDSLSELNDTINEANQSILNSIQKEIDLQRQIRDNTDTEKEIADIEARLAMLQRDTTGANQQEILELQKQLDEARENYSDTLVDQAIDRLSQNNDDAQEQREKQIELLEAQLEYWQETGALWEEVANLIAEGFTSQGSIIEGSTLWEFLKNKDSWNGLSEAQKINWANDLIREANQVGAYFYQFSDNGTITAQEIIDSIIGEHGLAGEITAETRMVRAQLNELIKQLGGTPIDSIPGEGGYASGGLATKTGYAMLHGTANEPEYVLNARQTDAFLRLADVLPSIFGGNGYGTNNFGGNVYVELNMNVGEIGSDYDVDRLVDRVKEDIYDASSYRNVNAVSFLR